MRAARGRLGLCGKQELGDGPGVAKGVMALERVDAEALHPGRKSRGSILALEVVGDGELRLASQHGEPLVRPDDVLQALASVDEACRAPAGVSLTRLHQGEWRDGEVVDPF